MGEELDYTTLMWVKDEIQESLKQTQQALEAFVEDPSDTTQIRFCATYLHQVYGTLQMVEIYGAALLAEEMEKVANALLNEQIAQKDDALDVLMRAILQLPNYLESLERGQTDMPVVLTPLLNDLRAARGEPLLSENAFFSPDLNVAPPEKQLPPGKELPEIQAYARKLRPIFQVALLGWFREKDTAGSLKKLSAVLRELQNASNTEAGQRLWWIGGGITEALLEEGLDTSVSVKLLMGQIDREIKRVIDHGEDIISTEPPAELLKNCLYYVGSAQSTGPRVSALKQAFNLDQLMPYGGAMDQAMDDLKGSTADIMQNVSSVIKDDLLHVKDQLDIFVRNTARNIEELTPLSENLNRTADTLAMLGLGDLRKVIQDQVTNIQQLVEAGTDPEDDRLMEIASALLYVEASLDTLEASRRAHAESEAPDLSVHEDEESAGHEVLLPPSEQIQITNLVIKEAKEVLADVKEGFNTFALEPEQRDPITEAPAKLKQIKGALSVMNLDRAAALLGSAIAFIQQDVLDNPSAPDAAKLDTLADAITSIEYYLEAIEEGRGRSEGVLAVAEISVEQLGHPVGAASAESGASELEPREEKEEDSLSLSELSLDETAPLDEELEAPIEFEVEAEPELSLTEEPVAAEPEAPLEFELEAEPELGLTEETGGEELETPLEFETEAEPVEQPAATSETAAATSVEEEEYLEEDIDEEILEIFVEEADEVLGTMTDCLHAWRANNEDQKSLETLRRSYHTIKGSGRLAGAMVMGEFAWALENMLNRVLDGKVAPSPGMFKLLDEAEATLRGLLAHLKGEADTRPPVKALSDQAYALADGQELAASDIVTTGSGAAASAEAPAVEEEEAAAPETEITFEAEIEPETEIELAPETGLEQEAEISFENEVDTGLEQETEAEMAYEAETGLEDELSIAPEVEPELTLDDSSLETEAPASEAEETKEEPGFDPVLVQVFRKETDTHLSALHHFLDSVAGQSSAPVNDDVHRALHTLHGSARMANVTTIADLSEPMDRLVRTMHEHHVPFDSEGLDTLRQFVESVESLVKDFDSNTPSEDDHSALLAQIAQLHERALEHPAPAETAEPVAAASAEDEELIAIFLEEAEEILRDADALMQQWEANPDDLALIGELQRALHTLKGGARLANLNPIGDLTHELETVLEAVTEGRSTNSDALPGLVQHGLDWLVQAIEQVREGNALEPASALLQQIAQLTSGAAPEIVAEDEAPGLVEETPAEELESDLLLDEVDEAPIADLEAELEPEVSEPLAAELEETLPAADEALAETEEFEEFEEAAEPATPQPVAAETTATTEVDYDPDLLEIFLEEAEEIQENTERVLHEWLQDRDNLDHVAELQRSLHTLKGGARMANVTAVGDLAHAMESLLERLTDGRLKVEPQHPDLIQTCHDWLVHGLETAQKLQPIEPATELVAQIEAAIRGEQYVAAEPVAEEATPEVIETAPVEETLAPETGAAEEEIPAPAAEIPTEETEEVADAIAFAAAAPEEQAEKKTTAGAEEQVRVRAELLNDLVNYSGEINIYNSRIAQQIGVQRFNLTELDQTVTRLQEQLRKFEMETEAQIMYRHESTSVEDDDFDPLEMDRFSTMQQISRSMVESLGDLTSIQRLLDNLSSETDVLLLQQQRVTGELQEGLMRTRMVAFSSVLPRLRRILRQTCKETNKEAELLVTGGEGELDRTQLNRIVPALEHILRNAVDHGLESPSDREKAGKPASGNVHIVFAHQGSEVVLTISDDGSGINIDALRNKAIEKGRMLPDADLTDTEIMEFILESGFSTAEAVTQISGRGVGMDVVNTEIKQLGGTLHIDSEAGKGTTFTLRLPLTVLVNQALMVQVSESTYAIQLPNVEHVVRAGREEIEPMISGEKAIFEYAGNQYGYLNLGTVLHGTPPVLPAEKTRVPLMLVRSGDHRVAMHVDNLMGRQEIVIKAVGPQLSSVGVLSGATILPDGEVALILDVGNLVRSALAQQHGKAAPLMPAAPTEAAAAQQAVTVMVVDDSITVRKVTERLLKRYDYNIITAKDGVDALTVMLEQIPDVMLLDVEMPRMDGYELASTMRNDERLKKVPIIMITSRTGDKHRQRALDIGVNMYMGKPYQEQELIQNIRTLTGEEQG